MLAGGFVVSSLALAAFELVCVWFMPQPASRWLARGAVAALVALAATWGWRAARDVLRAQPFWQRCSLGLLAAAWLFWLAAMPLSPYPSQATMGLGDPPTYYHAAAMLAAGRGWAPAYFAAGYPGGLVSYVQTHPVPPLVTAFFFHVFGTNWHSLFVFDAIAALLLVHLAAAVVRGEGERREGDGPHVLLLAAALLLVPGHFVLFGLGVVTVPGALCVLTLAALGANGKVEPRARRLVVGATVALMLLVRPEAALLAVLLGVAFGVRWLLVGGRLRRWARGAALGACAAAAAGAWLGLPALAGRLPRGWESLSVFFLRYDPAGGRFVETVNPWWEYNRRMCRANFTGEDLFASGVANRAAPAEVRDHPVGFIRYALGGFPHYARFFVRAFTVAQFELRWLAGWPSAAVVLVLLALATRNRGGGAVAAAVLAWLLVLPVLNRGVSVRHMLVVSPTVLALALRPIWARWHGLLERLAARRECFVAAGAVLLVLALLDGRSIIRIRTYAPNTAWVPILRDIERIAGPDDLVATSYPQLVTCVTGRPSVGGTWLTENLDLIVKTRRPEVIVVDDTNDVARNYQALEKLGLRVPGYEAVAHDEARRYIVFRRRDPESPSPAGEPR